MAELRIAARVEEVEGAYLVRSPAVGVVEAVPETGVYLNAMEGFLTLRVLGQRKVVALPRGVEGRVVERLVEGRWVPVEYNQPLLRLRAGQAAGDELAAPQIEAAQGLDQDLIAVLSPTDGIFHRQPTPESPPYVEEGAPVTRGTVLGLVEVMKSFNRIVYGGPHLPERGVVARVLAENAAEVKFGQPLFKIRAEK